MGTTIHVEEEIKQVLDNIRKKERVGSINEAIKIILEKSKEISPKSLFGIDKGKKIKVERIETHEI